MGRTSRGMGSNVGGISMPKVLRDESTPEGKAMWAVVDRTAAKCPEWVKRKVDEAWEKKMKEELKCRSFERSP